MKKRMATLLDIHWPAFLVGAALLIYMATYLMGSFGDPIRADGAGYFIYLPSIVLHGDTSLEAIAEQHYGGEIPEWTGCRKIDGRGYVDKYGVGTAWMMLPFFGMAHLLTWMMNTFGAREFWAFQYPLDGFSPFYQHAAGLSGMFYMLVGLILIHGNLRQCFSRRIAGLTIFVLVVGTNLLHYMSGETVQSHSYSLFLFALLLRLAPRWNERHCDFKTGVALGMCVGMIGMVRLPNVLFAMTIPLYGLSSWQEVRCRSSLYVQQWRKVLWAGAWAFVGFIPQFVVWRLMGGSWFLNAYGAQGEGFDFFHPAVLNTLFSLKGGVFFWAPALLPMWIGLVLMKKRASEWRWAVWLYLPLQLWIISSWHMWWFGGGFGHRGFIESYVLAAFPLAAVFDRCDRGWARRAMYAYLVAAIAWNLFMMKLYYTRELSYYGLDGQALFDIFWNRKEYILFLFGG